MEVDFRAMEREIHQLREELAQRRDQQRVLEQIVTNVTSLLDGADEVMCIFDKEGYFLHMNSSCRRLLGLEPSSRLTMFDCYSPWDREKVRREAMSKIIQSWSGVVTLVNKHTGYETTVMQTIELVPNKHAPETTFYKSYISVQQETSNEKLRMFNDLIFHMPHGVGIWRLERGTMTAFPSVLRLVCANKTAPLYVGVPLLPGAPLHDVIKHPAGIEVHRFLEDVVRTQRVLALDNFRIGPHHSFAVTAFPIYPDLVVVVMDWPKSAPSPTLSPVPALPTSASAREIDYEWTKVVASSGLAVAVCEGGHVVNSNEHFAAMLAVPQPYLTGRDAFSVLDGRARSRAPLDQLRRAVRERAIHHVEIELEHHAWRVSVQPMAEGARYTLLFAYRTRSLAPQPLPQRSMFPILPSSFPPTSSSRDDYAFEAKPTPSSSFHSELSQVFKELVEHIPCGIMIVRKDEEKGNLRLLSLNHTARSMPIAQALLTKNPQHTFVDDVSSPFDPAFVRAMHGCVGAHDGRVLYAGEKVLARIIPLRDRAHVAVVFENPSLFELPGGAGSIFDAAGGPAARSKRAITELVEEAERALPIFPTSKHMRTKEESSTFPFGKSLPAPSSSFPTFPLPFGDSSSGSSAGASSTTGTQISARRAEKLQLVFQHCIIAVACLDSNGHITLANKSFLQMLGFSLDSDLPVLTDIVHPDDESHTRSALRGLLRGEATSLELPMRFTHTHHRGAVWGVANFVSFEHGVIMQVLQPTRLKHFPEVLMSDRDVLRSAFREMVVGTAVLDVDTHPRIVSANSGFCAIMASSESDLSGRSLIDTLHEDDRDAVLAVARDVTCSRAPRTQLLSVRSNPKTGPARYGALSLSAILDSHARPFLLVAQLQLVDKPFA